MIKSYISDIFDGGKSHGLTTIRLFGGLAKWLLSGSEAGGDLALIQTSLFSSCKCT